MYILTNLAEISSPSSYKPPFNSAERDITEEDIQTEQSIRPMRWQAYKQFTPVARRFLDVFGPKIIADAYFYGQLDPFIKAVTARLTADGFHNLRQLTDRGKTQQAIDLIKNLTQTRTVHFQQVFRGVGRGLGEVPSCTSSNCSAISVDRFDKQPADFQRVLAKSFNDPAGWFGNLDPLSRFALTAIYNRLCHFLRLVRVHSLGDIRRRVFSCRQTWSQELIALSRRK